MSKEREFSILGEVEEFVNKEARAVALNFQSLVIRITPMDTGRAAGNWFIDINRPSRKMEESRRAQQAMSENELIINKATNIDWPTLYISNNLPYIGRLNDGYSTKAPAKFVETSLKIASR